jgi:hypothetical protein
MVQAGPDGRFAEEAVRGELVWVEVQTTTPQWILENPNIQRQIVYRFCNINNLDTMTGDEQKAVTVTNTVRTLIQRQRPSELINQYWTTQAATATIHGRGGSAFVPATLDFMLLANDFNPLIQKIVRSPQNYHDFNRLIGNLGQGAQEVNATQRAPTLACFVVPDALAVDTREFNENSERVREVVVFRSLLPYLVAWANNPF